MPLPPFPPRPTPRKDTPRSILRPPTACEPSAPIPRSCSYALPRHNTRSGFLVSGIRGRSTSDARAVPTQPLDLDSDRLARACGQPPLANTYRPTGPRVKDPGTLRNPDMSPSYPPLPKAKVGHMYRRLDTLARRSGRRAMDYLSFEDIAVIHRQDNHFRDRLRKERRALMEEKHPDFHAIGTPLEEVLLYASTNIIINGYRYHLPTVVVACVEELTKTGIYQNGLFRALPSRDRHLQLIDLFDKSPDFGAHFSMRGQAMPDICALLSTFISSLPTPLLDPQIYSALWHWSIKPSVKRDDARRDRLEEEEEERRARGEPPPPVSQDDPDDGGLETDQIYIAQILLRLIPSANLSLLVYLCSFFTQLPLCPENEIQLEDVARIFGPRLLGGSVKSVSHRMMYWLLTRWPRISDTLFEEACGMSAPGSPSCPTRPPGSAVTSEDTHEPTEKRQENLGNTSDARTTSIISAESPQDHDGSPPRGGDEQGKLLGEIRRRRKRELDVQDLNDHVPPTESRHVHRRTRRGSGSSSHAHHAWQAPAHGTASPDPFAIAFSKAHQDASATPPPTNPVHPTPSLSGGSNDTKPARRPLRVDGSPSFRLDNGVHLDMRVVDALVQETAAAMGAARALTERVAVLERKLQVRGGEEEQQEEQEDQVVYPTIHRPSNEAK